MRMSVNYTEVLLLKRNNERFIKRRMGKTIKLVKNKPKIIKEINIPEQIRGFNFVLDGGNGKQPIEKHGKKRCINRLS